MSYPVAIDYLGNVRHGPGVTHGPGCVCDACVRVCAESLGPHARLALRTMELVGVAKDPIIKAKLVERHARFGWSKTRRGKLVTDALNGIPCKDVWP